MSNGKVYRETPDYVEGLRRQVRALGKRIASEDPADLAHLQALDADLAEAWSAAIAGLRTSGYSDRAIGAQLGVTKQAVQDRWPR